MRKYFKYLPLLLILVAAFILRIYKAEPFFYYAHDNDLASWIIKDILVNHHFRLIGQQTSVLGVFIGGLFYYMQIPFYLLGRMDPLPVVYLTVILGTFCVFSVYFVFNKIFGKGIATIGSIFFAVSKLIAFSDRGVYPTMPVMLWTIWFLYDLYLFKKGNQKLGFILFGILFALIWHFNIALYIITPLILIPLIVSKKKLNIKYLILGGTILVILSLPLIAFEIKHNFQQTNAIFESLTTNRNLLPETGTGFAKFDRTIQLVSTNTRNLLLPMISHIPARLPFHLLIGVFVLSVALKKISKDWALIFFLWQILYISFFSLNSLNVSEYYLDGMNVIWVAIVSIGLFALMSKNKLKITGIILVASYILWNSYLILTFPESTNGYIHKKAITSFIKSDAVEHGYPCVSVSYITNPGYDLGYRYFFYLENLHVNQSSSGSPVYTIVFPLSLVDSFDKRFGDLGLILPDYKKYNGVEVNNSCGGANSNLTDPMFGYTE